MAMVRSLIRSITLLLLFCLLGQAAGCIERDDCDDPEDYCIETDDGTLLVREDGSILVCSTMEDGCVDGVCYTDIPTADDISREQTAQKLEWVDSVFTYTGVAKCALAIAYQCIKCVDWDGPHLWFLTSEVIQAAAFMFKEIDWTFAAESYMGDNFERESDNHIRCLDISVEAIILAIVSLLQCFDACLTLKVNDGAKDGKWKALAEFGGLYVLPGVIAFFSWCVWASLAFQEDYCDVLPMALMVICMVMLCCSCCWSCGAFQRAQS